jgi:hypothetical protein
MKRSRILIVDDDADSSINGSMCREGGSRANPTETFTPKAVEKNGIFLEIQECKKNTSHPKHYNIMQQLIITKKTNDF